jgi:hypothetical protein
LKRSDLEKNTMAMDKVKKTDTSNSVPSPKTFRDEQLIFVMVKCGVFFAVRTEFLNII